MDVDDRMRLRGALPPIESLRMDKSFEDDHRQQPKYPPMSGLPAASPQLPSPSTTTHPAPPTAFSYPLSANSSGQPTGYISPPDSRRTTRDEGDQSGTRQSLPSIHEALSSNPIPYQPSAQPTTQPAESAPLSAPPAPAHPSRSYLGGPQGPPNPFAQPAVGPREPPAPPSTTLSQIPPQQEDQRLGSISSVNGIDQPRPGQTYNVPRSPRTATSSTFAGSSNRSPTSGSAFVSNSAASPPTIYGSFRSPFPPSSHASHHSSALVPSEDQNRQFSSSWKFDGSQKYPSSGPLVQGHTESVKRHLDIYESEMAFNDVLDGSGRIFDFSKVFTQRLHQNQRSEISLDSLPSLQEVDDMVKHAHRLHDGLDRIRNSIIFQQQALADERSRAYQNKLYQEEVNGYHDEFKGGFAAGDSKKRRGKAAPPGRCHSCNRAETPEWRRGPDGARTLCNACGLHYAKLTRKNGANKGSIGGSNLRPKNDVAQ